jgi:hypothetical protein
VPPLDDSSATCARRGRTVSFERELDAHLALHLEDQQDAGMTADEGRRQAKLALGGMTVIRDRYRDRGHLPWLDAWASDVRQSLRASPRS